MSYLTDGYVMCILTFVWYSFDSLFWLIFVQTFTIKQKFVLIIGHLTCMAFVNGNYLILIYYKNFEEVNCLIYTDWTIETLEKGYGW